MSSARPVLNLGRSGKVPIDTLYQLYLETLDGHVLTLHQSRIAHSLGSWVYDGASVLAKYIEAYVINGGKDEQDISDKRHHLSGRTVVELGAGTGIVGVLMGYYGADVITTDLQTLVPLIQFNIEQNAASLGGRVKAAELCWGEEIPEGFPRPADYVILANCVYYEGVLELLCKTTYDLAGPETVVYASYEERVPEIAKLIGRWHDIVGEFFTIEDIPQEYYRCFGELDCVRIVRMKKKS